MVDGMSETSVLPGISLADLYRDPQPLPPPAGRRPSADKAAVEFEAVFLAQMLEHMFEEVDEDSLFADPESEEIYRSWLADAYGNLVANAGGVGIADQVRRELLKAQEMTSGAGL